MLTASDLESLNNDTEVTTLTMQADPTRRISTSVPPTPGGVASTAAQRQESEQTTSLRSEKRPSLPPNQSSRTTSLTAPLQRMKKLLRISSDGSVKRMEQATTGSVRRSNLSSRQSVTLPNDLRARGMHAALARRHSVFPVPYPPQSQALREAYNFNRRRSLNSGSIYCDDIRALRGPRRLTSPLVLPNEDALEPEIPPAPPTRRLSNDLARSTPPQRDPTYAGLERDDAERYIRLYSYAALDLDPHQDSMDLSEVYGRIRAAAIHQQLERERSRRGRRHEG